MGRHKGVKEHGKVYVNIKLMRNIFKDNHTSVRSLGTKDSKRYIGWSDKSIYRVFKDGVMSVGLYDAIMKEIDISQAVTSSDSYLANRVDILERKIELLDERVKYLEKTI